MSRDNNINKLVGSVSKDMEEQGKVEKVTSGDMFKGSIMNFINKEMEKIDENNLDVLTSQQNQVNQKLFELIEEDSLEVSDLFRFSELLSKQKTSESSQQNQRIEALFKILQPSKDSSNPLLNNERNEEGGGVGGELTSNQLQVLLKFSQLFAQQGKEADD